MNRTGRNNYLVMVLLLVGLTAFSSTMKELSQVHELALDAGRLVAHWSDMAVPNNIPQTVVKLETCNSKVLEQSVPAVELPWLSSVTEPSAVAPARSSQINIQKIERDVRSKPGKLQVARIRKERRVDFDPVQLEVRISSEQDAESDEPIISELPVSMFKAKTRKHGAIRINPRDREMLLKTLNRSINLRIAS